MHIIMLYAQFNKDEIINTLVDLFKLLHLNYVSLVVHNNLLHLNELSKLQAIYSSFLIFYSVSLMLM